MSDRPSQAENELFKQRVQLRVLRGEWERALAKEPKDSPRAQELTNQLVEMDFLDDLLSQSIRSV